MKNIALYIALSKALKKKVLNNEIYTFNTWEQSDRPSEPIRRIKHAMYDVTAIKLAAFDEILEILEDDLEQEIRDMINMVDIERYFNKKPFIKKHQNLRDLYFMTLNSKVV